MNENKHFMPAMSSAHISKRITIHDFMESENNVSLVLTNPGAKVFTVGACSSCCIRSVATPSSQTDGNLRPAAASTVGTMCSSATNNLEKFSTNLTLDWQSHVVAATAGTSISFEDFYGSNIDN